MITNINGNCIRYVINSNELKNNTLTITLPDGYSYESIKILYAFNIKEITPHLMIHDGDCYNFPPVKSFSPSVFVIWVPDISKAAEIRISIEKFGQIPDAHYFDKAFDPILVTGEDGKEYKVIPSNQFK